MAQANWSYLTGGLDAATVARGVSAGFTPPNGGSTYVYGFNSLNDSTGVVGLFNNALNFDPMLDDLGDATGGSIRGAIKRGLSGAHTGFAPFFFMGLTGDSVSDEAYMLGLSDDSPNTVILKKGPLNSGLVPDSTGVLGLGATTYLPDIWHHLRLDVIVNPNGDVILKCYYSDLTSNPVTAPVWQAIPGLETFIDDALSVNSGTAPLIGGRAGWGFYTSEISRRGFYDHIQVARQR